MLSPLPHSCASTPRLIAASISGDVLLLRPSIRGGRRSGYTDLMPFFACARRRLLLLPGHHAVRRPLPAIWLACGHGSKLATACAACSPIFPPLLLLLSMAAPSPLMAVPPPAAFSLRYHHCYHYLVLMPLSDEVLSEWDAGEVWSDLDVLDQSSFCTDDLSGVLLDGIWFELDKMVQGLKVTSMRRVSMIQVQNKNQQVNNQALVRCEYSMANFSTGDRTRRPKGDRHSTEISLVIRQTMEACTRSQIDIFVQVLQADGGTISACINAATLALADAGIPMRDIVTSCSTGYVDGTGYLSSTPLLDLNYIEDNAGSRCHCSNSS